MTNKLKSKKRPGVLYISASQISTFDEQCNRKWWFEKIAKLPTVQKAHFAFGTCLHGCLERWILSTPNGRVPGSDKWASQYEPALDSDIYTEGPFNGQGMHEVTELFPEGFETVTEVKDGEIKSSFTLTPNEARQIKKLVAQAIERGIVTKGDDVFVEHGFELDLIEGVVIVGFLDLLRKTELPEIHDHKSFGKSSVRYLAQPGPKDDGGLIPIVAPYKDGDGTSPNSVGHKQQNLTYAWAHCMIEGYDGPVLVRHNQFPKFEDDKGVRHVEALVGHKRLVRHDMYLQDVAARMVKVSKIKKWTDTPPPKVVTACSDFGGCDFQDICGHRINLELYSKRTERHNEQRATVARPNFPIPKKRSKTMGPKSNIFTKKAAETEGEEEAAPAKASVFKKKAPAAEAEETPGINSGTKASKESIKNGAPWANPDCPACRGLGMNSKGAACPICDKTAAKRGVPTSKMYEIEVLDEGFMAAARKEHEEEIQELGAETEWQFEREAAAAPAKQAKLPFGKKKAEPEEDAEAEEVDEPAAPKKSLFKKKAPAQTEEEAQEEEEAEEAAPAKKPFLKRAPGKAQDDAEAEDEPTPAKSNVFKRRAAQEEPEAEEEEEPEADSEEPVRRGPGRPKGAKNKTPQEREANIGGRPRAGCILAMGAAPLHGPDRPRMMAQTLLDQLGTEMATDMGAESYFQLDGKKRQDALKTAGAKIAEDLGRTIVIFPGGTNDFDLIALFNALSPHAEWVWERLG